MNLLPGYGSRQCSPKPPTPQTPSCPMTYQAERIRAEIRQQFHDFGAAEGAHAEETILINDGYYCGRRFRCDGFEAVWFIEENQIKFFDQDGTVRLTRTATPVGKPAEEQAEMPAGSQPSERRAA